MLVDNGSEKQQLKEVESFVSGIIKSDLNYSIEISSLKPNKGFGKGMNHGLKHHFKDKTEWIFTLSNDVEISSDFFYNFLKIEKPDNSILCPHTYYLMNKNKISYTHGFVDIKKDDLKLNHCIDINKNQIIFPEYYPAARACYGPEILLKKQTVLMKIFIVTGKMWNLV